MSNLRHPDIEIYIKNQTPEQIIDWLRAQAVSVNITKQSDHSTHLKVMFNTQDQGEIDTLLQQKVSGKAWNSLWFKENKTPWDTDIDCASNASNALQSQVRCIKSGWTDSEAADAEQWWKVEDGHAELIQWQN